MISRSDWEPLPKPTLSPFERGYLSLCRFFTAAVWCVPAVRAVGSFSNKPLSPNSLMPVRAGSPLGEGVSRILAAICAAVICVATWAATCRAAAAPTAASTCATPHPTYPATSIPATSIPVPSQCRRDRLAARARGRAPRQKQGPGRANRCAAQADCRAEDAGGWQALR